MPAARAVRGVAWTTSALTTILALGTVATALVEPALAATGADGIGRAAYEAVVYSTIGVLGAVVTSREPRNPIGWFLQVIPLALAIGTLSDQLYVGLVAAGDTVGGAVTFLAWLASWVWIPAMVPAFTLFPLLFPTGRTVSPRWQPLVWISIAAGTLLLVGTAFSPASFEDYAGIDNPLGVPGAEVVGNVAFVVLIPTALASIASVVIRFRRSTGVERQQLKWFVAAAMLLPIAFSGAGLDDESGYLVLIGGLFVVAGAVAIAMLRYRLYDLHVVINRAVVYGSLTATLAVTYVGGVLLLQLALRPFAKDSDLAIAGSTLAVAALFRPARAWIQRSVDRRFYRSRYDASRTLAAFSAGLRDQVDLDALGRDLREVVGASMQPAHVSLWLRETQ